MLSTLMWIVLGFAMLAVAFASGCGARVVLVPEQAPIRTGPGMSGRVWVMHKGEWTLSQNRVPIPEGMYIVSPSWVDLDEGDQAKLDSNP